MIDSKTESCLVTSGLLDEVVDYDQSGTMTGIDFSSRTMSGLAFIVGLIFVLVGTIVTRLDMQSIGILFTITGVFASVMTRYIERPKQ